MPFIGDYAGPSLILDAGFDGHVADNVSLDGDVDWHISLNNLGNSVGGKIGLKMNW